MGVKSDLLAQQVLDYMFGLGSDGPVAPTFYFALNTTQVATNGTGGVEVSGSGYARVGMDPTTDFDRTGQVVENIAEIDFGTAGADWAPGGSPVIAYSVWDAPTGGNLIMTKALIAPRIILTGDSIKFPVGSLQYTEI